MPVMSYISMTAPGIVRGPHEHAIQSDLLCFFGQARFRLFLWDNRPDSSTFGKKFQTDIDPPISILVPPGVVHAYKNIGLVDGFVANAPNKLYAGPGRVEPVDEIRHENDKEAKFQID
jgi:dTDP-4-dehydrorhamnose 3,5-epimerase